MSELKYGVVVGEPELIYWRLYHEVLSNAKSTRAGLPWEFENRVSELRGRHVRAFARVQDFIDFNLYMGNLAAIGQVVKDPTSVDLVIMGLSSMREDDSDGFKAARYLRDKGFKGRITLQSLFGTRGYRREMEATGVDEIIHHCYPNGLFKYILKNFAGYTPTSQCKSSPPFAFQSLSH